MGSATRLEDLISQEEWYRLYVYVKTHLARRDRYFAEDLVQDVILEAMQKEEDVRDAFKVRSFLQSWATFKIKHFYKTNGNGHHRTHSLESLIEMQEKDKVFFKEFLADDIETYLEKQGLSVLIHDAIEGLPYPYREVVKLRVYQQVPFKAIAVAFEKKDATVRQWSRRGFRMVQKKLIRHIGCAPYAGRSSNGGKHGKTKKERNGHQSSG